MSTLALYFMYLTCKSSAFNATVYMVLKLCLLNFTLILIYCTESIIIEAEKT